MMKKNTSVHINLLPKDPFLDTPVGRILSWASAAGRYLVIFTELVVIMSIGTRFRLDRQLTDLNELLFQKSALVSSYGTLEQEVRTIQKKTGFIAEKSAISQPLETLEIITKKMPTNTYFTTAQITGNSIEVTGVALSSRDFTSFVRALQSSPQVVGILVGQVKNAEKGKAGLEFSMTVEVKK